MYFKLLNKKVKDLNIFKYFRVDEKLRLKVTDNGLARDLFPDDYHCLGDNENRPVKWMAPETLLQNQYSTASDVVSYIFNPLLEHLFIKIGMFQNSEEVKGI